MKYTHVVFDVDGTLIDSEKAVLLALQKTLSEVEGKIYPLEKLQFSFGIPGEDALKQLNVKDIDYCNQICNEREADYSYTTKLFDGIQSTLCRRREFRLELLLPEPKRSFRMVLLRSESLIFLIWSYARRTRRSISQARNQC